MNAQTYRFERNFRIIHNIYVPAMADKDSRAYVLALFKSKEFLKYKAMADLVYRVQVQEDDDIIERYGTLMEQRITDNCRRYNISVCGEKNMQLMLKHRSVEEIAAERGSGCSNISTQNCASQNLLRLKKQKVNSNEKMLRILMQKSSPWNNILLFLYFARSKF